jgi:hypothetical protein
MFALVALSLLACYALALFHPKNTFFSSYSEYILPMFVLDALHLLSCYALAIFHPKNAFFSSYSEYILPIFVLDALHIPACYASLASLSRSIPYACLNQLTSICKFLSLFCMRRSL